MTDSPFGSNRAEVVFAAAEDVTTASSTRSDATTPTVTDVADRRRFEITVDAAVVGFAEYRRRPGVISFIHTEIDAARNGEGLGTMLVKPHWTPHEQRGWRCSPTVRSSRTSSTVIANTSTSCRPSDAPSLRQTSTEGLSGPESAASLRPIPVELRGIELGAAIGLNWAYVAFGDVKPRERTRSDPPLREER
jgi:predicted GNAT family acetyltransferase